ncbi:HMA5 [Symbiodinium sp. CCMP2592]|nr:HMA5 [Symbiodinium sp. CCMP2592]
MASPHNRLLDDAMAKYAAKEWTIQEHSTPVYVNNSQADISECIRLSDLEKHACRRDLPKTCVLVLDAHYQIAEFGNLLSVCERLSNQDYSALPPRLQPSTSLPHGATVSYIIHNLQDGTMDVLRIIRFTAKVAAKEAKGFCTGLPLFFAYREGPWSWKKAVHALLGRLPGHHVVWWTLCEKELKRAQSTAWTASDDELVKGVDFVNKNAPEDDSENQQYLWILTNIKADSGSPIAGWPEGKIIRIAQDKSRANVGASSRRFFPMTTKSMKPFMGDFGIVTIGWPGVGKTPLLIILALAIGRYHINRLELEGVSPGWRRAKAMDNFRHRNAQIHEGLILDDLNMDKMEPADVKSWLTSEEDQNCSGRYTDVKLVANGLRALAANDFVPEDEPLPDKHHTSMEPKEFFNLVKKFFVGYKEADMMAVLKRCIMFIFGKRATYLLDDLHEDLFTPRDKDFYAKYKVGIHEPPPTFEADIAKEQELLLQGIESMQTAGRPETYMAEINQKIADKIGSLTRASTAVHLPASPSTDEETAVPVPFPEALPVACVNPPGRMGQFQYPPPKRRLTSKTSMTSEIGENLETPTHIAGGMASSTMEPPATACDDDPDEQAARDMHN